MVRHMFVFVHEGYGVSGGKLQWRQHIRICIFAHIATYETGRGSPVVSRCTVPPKHLLNDRLRSANQPYLIQIVEPCSLRRKGGWGFKLEDRVFLVNAFQVQ